MLIPVILSGGAGTRLWPVSRESHPKPFIKMADGESLLLKTLQRALATGASEVLTVTNRDYYFITRDEYSALKPPAKVELRYLLEPAGRNTAPDTGHARGRGRAARPTGDLRAAARRDPAQGAQSTEILRLGRPALLPAPRRHPRHAQRPSVRLVDRRCAAVRGSARPRDR